MSARTVVFDDMNVCTEEATPLVEENDEVRRVEAMDARRRTYVACCIS
ncbi:MAG TPA: hypothetical protein VGK73_24685 [Polyangiaceae bacterium]